MHIYVNYDHGFSNQPLIELKKEKVKGFSFFFYNFLLWVVCNFPLDCSFSKLLNLVGNISKIS